MLVIVFLFYLMKNIISNTNVMNICKGCNVYEHNYTPYDNKF